MPIVYTMAVYILPIPVLLVPPVLLPFATKPITVFTATNGRLVRLKPWVSAVIRQQHIATAGNIVVKSAPVATAAEHAQVVITTVFVISQVEARQPQTALTIAPRPSPTATHHAFPTPSPIALWQEPLFPRP